MQRRVWPEVAFHRWPKNRRISQFRIPENGVFQELWLVKEFKLIIKKWAHYPGLRRPESHMLHEDQEGVVNKSCLKIEKEK